MSTLNIIGAGRLGRTLGRLWQTHGFFRIQSICNRTLESAQSAVEFIGAGSASPSIETLTDADCWLIASGDAQIAPIAKQVATRLEEGNIVFHCSGALSSKVLSPCRPATIASAHPVHSFADPQQSLRTLADSSTTLEGDNHAVALLRRAFAALGCKTLSIEPENKTLYHAGSVLACNYLTGLMDLSLRTFAAAGIDGKQARRLLKPIVLQTAQNNMQLGPEKSLTGPIARGDLDTVAAQVDVLQKLDPQLAQCYRQLGLACVELARRGQLADDDADQLAELLNTPTAK